MREVGTSTGHDKTPLHSVLNIWRAGLLHQGGKEGNSIHHPCHTWAIPQGPYVCVLKRVPASVFLGKGGAFLGFTFLQGPLRNYPVWHAM